MRTNPYLETEAESDSSGIAIRPGIVRLEKAIGAARDALIAKQSPDGWWCGDLEADTTCESYLILLYAFLDRMGDPSTAANVGRLAARIRTAALAGGGWSAYAGGPAELSVSTLSYFALKVAGEPEGEPHMQRARAFILSAGGAARASSYVRYHLALFGQCSWDEVPAIPPEMIFLPAGGPFSVYDMSSWSRAIFVPLSIIYGTRPVCPLPAVRGARELFKAGGGGRLLARWGFFHTVDRGLKLGEGLPGAAALRRSAIRRAAAWMIERLQDSDGLGAILPAMANSVIALRCLGHGDDSSLLRNGVAELERLFKDDRRTGALRVQPCLSPVWDTCLAAHALAQTGIEPDHPALGRAAAWVLGRQCRRAGDWAVKNPAAPGGWAFEFRNDFYPDVDDTAMALMVLREVAGGDRAAVAEAEQRGLGWLLGMQNDDGGWASFDRGNDKRWLTRVPFADHNAMIDPSTADISGRVLECLSHLDGFNLHHPVVQRALRFLRADQSEDGSWFGRWGVNYIYGTWQVLRGLNCIGEDMEQSYVRRAARWLADRQNADGGWGESIASYYDQRFKGTGPSTPSQTAWAVMGLIAAYDTDGASVRAGIRYLLEHQAEDGGWPEEPWTGTGFPRVFYLKYDLYAHYFPLMALSQYAAAKFPGRRGGG
jgi:squalene-hopene/tetraprenyl-beta-curcumene cyclase